MVYIKPDMPINVYACSAYLQQNPSSPWYHQFQIDEKKKPAVGLTCLIINDIAKDDTVKLTDSDTKGTIWNKNTQFRPFPC